MSFKHIKFEDSEVMRSLEKVGIAKGIVKVANPTKSIHELLENRLKPSGNLTQDIIKLCSSLRQEGFESYASELERKFITFKRAESLYETSKEKGDDLIDAAHPEGSHKIKGVLGDAVVETVLDRQLAFLNVIDKKPTGKLAAKDITNAIKYALGQQISTELPEDTTNDKKETEMEGYRQHVASRYLLGAYKKLGECESYINKNLNPTLTDDEGVGFIKDLKNKIKNLIDVYADVSKINHSTDAKIRTGEILLEKIDEMLPITDKLIEDINNTLIGAEKRRDQRNIAAKLANKVQSQISAARSIIAKNVDSTVEAVITQEKSEITKSDAIKKKKKEETAAATAAATDAATAAQILNTYTPWANSIKKYLNETIPSYSKEFKEKIDDFELQKHDEAALASPNSDLAFNLYVKKINEFDNNIKNQAGLIQKYFNKINSENVKNEDKARLYPKYKKFFEDRPMKMIEALHESAIKLTPSAPTKQDIEYYKKSKSADIIRAVKIALGEGFSNYASDSQDSQVYKQIKPIIKNFPVKIISGVDQITNAERANFAMRFKKQLIDNINSFDEYTKSSSNIFNINYYNSQLHTIKLIVNTFNEDNILSKESTCMGIISTLVTLWKSIKELNIDTSVKSHLLDIIDNVKGDASNIINTIKGSNDNWITSDKAISKAKKAPPPNIFNEQINKIKSLKTRVDIIPMSIDESSSFGNKIKNWSTKQNKKLAEILSKIESFKDNDWLDKNEFIEKINLIINKQEFDISNVEKKVHAQK